MTFETTIPNDYVLVQTPPDFIEAPVEKFKIYEEPKAELKPEVIKTILLTDKITEVDDDFKMKQAVELITGEQNTTSEPSLDPSSIVVDKIIEDTDVDFINVEVVPIYPGCENKKTNDDKRKCMSEKITKLVQRQFDTDLASELGLSGKQVIQTQFKIDKTGHVTDIKTRATHPRLEKEAQRVIDKIPEMTPGKQRDKNVGVIYSLPIAFQVQN